MMTVYLQGPNGEEHELKVTECDPPDGTLCAHLVGVDLTQVTEEFWARIVPEEETNDLSKPEIRMIHLALICRSAELAQSGSDALTNMGIERARRIKNQEMYYNLSNEYSTLAKRFTT